MCDQGLSVVVVVGVQCLGEVGVLVVVIGDFDVICIVLIQVDWKLQCYQINDCQQQVSNFDEYLVMIYGFFMFCDVYLGFGCCSVCVM